MLMNLSVKNYALIEDLALDFSRGLTCITGETGAGKSILVSAIELLRGARAESSAIRNGASSCLASATFEFKNAHIKELLKEQAIDFSNNEIIIRRVIESGGKSKAFINGRDAELTPKEFAILLKLVQNENKEVTYEQLYEDIWGMDMNNDSSVIRQQVSRLKKKIDEENACDFAIFNEHKKGYVFTMI